MFMITEWCLMPLFQENYTAPRMVLAASGVEHEELLSIAEPLLSDLPSTRPSEEPNSVYVGGEYRRQADTGVCISNHPLPLPPLCLTISLRGLITHLKK